MPLTVLSQHHSQQPVLAALGCCHSQCPVPSQCWGQQLSGETSGVGDGFKAGVLDVFAAGVILDQIPLPNTAEKCDGFSSAKTEQGVWVGCTGQAGV